MNKFLRTRRTTLAFRAFAAAIAVFSFFSLASAQDEVRLSATWQVKKYDLAVSLPQTESDRSVSVRSIVTVMNVSPRPATTLTLRISPNATISAVTIEGSPADFSKREEKIGSAALQQVVIRISPIAPGGTIRAGVDYKLLVKDNSGVAAISALGAQFLPLSFWYPTPNSWFFARGADYAPATIDITAAAGTQPLSAGLRAIPADSAGNIARFDAKVNLQPFIVSGQWDQLPQIGGIDVFVPKGSSASERAAGSNLAALTNEARAYFQTRLGRLPDLPVRLVAVRRGAGFSGGGVILFDSASLRRPKVDAQTALNVSEAVAKLWLGGISNVTGDGGDAIREGLARHLANEFLAEKFGREVGDVERARQRAAYAAVVQRDAPISTVSPLDDYYFSVVANKGSMIWRLLERKVGSAQFYARISGLISGGRLTLADIRGLFPEQKEFLDYAFDQITDMNLLAGRPQQEADSAKVALRNTGSVDATVEVVATLESGQKLSAPTTVRARSFGEVVFKTAEKVVRVEIDGEKLYPQTDYSDDIAPREFTETDGLLAVKRLFDKQDFVAAATLARKILGDLPAYDDVRILLARSLLSSGSVDEAEKEFQAVYDSKLPSARGLSWAMVGMADIAARRGRGEQAAELAKRAIISEGEYGASLAARSIRNRLNVKSDVDPSVVEFFRSFDKAAAGNQKAQLEALAVPGEVSRFVSSVAGQTVMWSTAVTHTDQIGPNTVLAEVTLNVKLLNREPESGMAVFRLVKAAGGWRLEAVEVFEVR